MTGTKKTALSLLITVLVFSTFVVISFTGLFNIIEIKFYQPKVVKSIEKNIDDISSLHTQYTQSLIERFTNYSSQEDVKSFLQKEPSANAQKSRTNLTGALINETNGLLGLRVIDNTGRKIHYSTFTKPNQDLKSQDSKLTSYNDYAKLATQPYSAINFKDIEPKENESYTATYYVTKNEKDKKTESCVIYALPFFDSEAKRQGTILFYCDTSGFNRYLLSKNLISFSGTGNIFAKNENHIGGIVFGLTEIQLVNTNVLEAKILELWETDNPLDVKDINIEELAETSNKKLHLFTKKTEENTFIGFVFDDAYLEMSNEAKFLLLAIVFITLFLTVFLLLNLKHDDMTVIKDRIKRFQLTFITEYIDKKDSGELKSLPQDIGERREQLTNEIKSSLGKRGKKHSQEVDKLLDSSWNEILTALGIKTVSPLIANKASIDSAELKSILEEILGSGKLKISASSIETSSPVEVKSSSPAQKITTAAPLQEDELEEVEELDDVEEIEEVDEAEELDEVEEIEEVADAEELDEVEEVDEAENLDEVEEIEEVAEAEELDEVEEVAEAENLDDAEEIEEVTEAETVDEAEEIEEVTETEELDDAEEIEEVTEAKNPDEAEEIKEVTETETADDAEEIEEVTEAETADEAEEIDVTDEFNSEQEISEIAEEVEETKEAEIVDEAEEINVTDEFNSEQEISEIAEDLTEKPLDTDNFMVEEMKFSSPSNKPVEDVADSFEISNFTTSTMDFSFLDIDDDFEDDYENNISQFIDEEDYHDEDFASQYTINEAEDGITESSYSVTEDFELDDINDISEEDVNDKIYDVEPLESPNLSKPFIFTAFAANNDNITELQAEQKDAIIENKDGTFKIERTEKIPASKLDANLKKLVDSVLK